MFGTKAFILSRKQVKKARYKHTLHKQGVGSMYQVLSYLKVPINKSSLVYLTDSDQLLSSDDQRIRLFIRQYDNGFFMQINSNYWTINPTYGLIYFFWAHVWKVCKSKDQCFRLEYTIIKAFGTQSTDVQRINKLCILYSTTYYYFISIIGFCRVHNIFY